MTDVPTKEQIDQIGNALAAGNKIEAIKLYREATGKGLKESKDFVDALVTKLAAQDPRKYANVAAQGKGCGAALILISAVILAGVAALLCLGKVS